MPELPRVALTSCLILTVLAGCNRDEPATYVPKSGAWIYEEQTVSSNTCGGDLVPDPQGMFYVDYDEGDSFQVELGENDVTCEIDGTAFYCTDLVFENSVDGFDAVLRTAITWEGDFLSPTAAEGEEITTVTCSGEACPLVAMLVTVPCKRIVSFEARAQ